MATLALDRARAELTDEQVVKRVFEVVEVP